MTSIGGQPPNTNPNAGVATSAGPDQSEGFVSSSQTQNPNITSTRVEGADSPHDANPGTGGKLPFKEQVKGYAKLTAGKVTGNKEEQELGQAKLDGKLDQPTGPGAPTA